MEVSIMVVALFMAQIALYAAVPFYLARLRNPLRVSAFYVYIGILLVYGGFLGSIYSLPILPDVNISGGNLAYGALLMTTVLLVIIERDVASVRHVVQLVITVNFFKFFHFFLLSFILNNEETLSPYGVDSGVFSLSLPITILGGVLIIVEVLILIFAFEQIKRRISNVTLVSILYTFCFLMVLCLDGLLFPLAAFTFNPQLVSIVIGGVTGKWLMGLIYSIPMLVFLLVYRHTLTEFVENPLTLSEMLKAPQARLVEEIQRQRASLALGEEQLRLYAHRLALATESAGLGIWDLDVRTNALVWDDQMFALYGLPVDDPNVSFEKWATLLHPDDRVRAVTEYQAALVGADEYHDQFRVVWPDGQVRYIESHATVQRGDDGAAVRMIGINWDVTQRKLLALENEALTDQFYQAQRLESIGRLAGGIAHDFNNLLVPITSFAELGQRKSEPGSVTDIYFKRIKEAADRAAALTRQILAFGRKQSMAMKAVNLHEIVRDFEPMLQRFVGEKVQVAFDMDDDAWPIWADPGQIEQVLMNLAVNARDAMPDGGTFTVATSKVHWGDGDVDVQAGTSAGNYMLLTVSDTGVGMDDAILQRVFEPFFTTKPLGEGSGLGLSTVFGIIKQHQGYIEIDSEVGRGTIFKIALPALQSRLDPPEDATEVVAS